MNGFSSLTKSKIACAWFFICIGMSYGMLTARMPAVKVQTGANDMQVGFSLLTLGAASLIALWLGPKFIDRWSGRKVLLYGNILVIISLIAVSFMTSPEMLMASCAILGFTFGLCDLTCNTQAIMIEQQFKTTCMATLHASFSLGGLIGSIGCAVAAYFLIGITLNWIIMLIICLAGLPLAYCWSITEKHEEPSATKTETTVPTTRHSLPLGIYLIGVMAMLAYAAEGSVAEWGSILLHSHKHVPESIAALVYGSFSAVIVIFRLCSDAIRNRIGNFIPLAGGGLVTTFGMGIVLYADDTLWCLSGYAIMGIGVAPIAPILMSLAGSFEGISAEKASSTVSLLAYAGMLFIPPSLGSLSLAFTLPKALLVIPIMGILIFLGALLLRMMLKKSASR